MKLLNKEISREIKNSFPRFLAIAIIVGLGVFVFVGLITSGPIMRRSIEKRIVRANFEDINLSVPLGFENKDIEIIESQDGIKELEYGIENEFIIKSSAELIKISNYPYKINMPEITSGSKPKKDEIILSESLKGKYKIGDTIYLKKEFNKFSMDEDEEAFLKTYEYKVAGFFISISHSSNTTIGQSSRGLGEIKSLGFIDESNFNIDPNFVKIKYKDLDGLKTSSKKYEDLVKKHKNALEIDFASRSEKRLLSSKIEIDNKLEDVEIKIADAKDKLEDAKSEIEEGKDKLLEGKKEYKKGEEKFYKEKNKAENKLKEAKDKLYKSEKEIKDNEIKLQDADKKLKDGKNELESAQIELEKGKAKYETGKIDYEKGKTKIEASEKQIIEGQEKLAEGRRKLDDAWNEINKNKVKIEEGKKELSENENKLLEGEAKLKAGLDQINEGLNNGGLNINTNSPTKTLEEIVKKETQLKQAKEVLDGYNEAISERVKVEKQLEELTTQKSTLEEQIKEIQVLPNTQEELDELRKQLEETTYKIEKVNEGLETINTSIGFLQANVDKINAQLGDHSVGELLKKLAIAKAGTNEIIAKEKELAEGKVKIEAAKKELQDGEKKLQDGINEANAGENEWLENRNKLEEGKSELIKGKEELSRAEKDLIEAKDKLNEGETKYIEGKSEYDENYKKYIEGKAELEKGKSLYEEGEKSYKEGLNEFEEEISKGEKDLNEAKSKLYKSEKDLIEGEKEYKEKSVEAEEKIKDAEDKISNGKRVLKLLKKPRYIIVSRNLNQDLYTFFDFSKRIDMLSMVFPVFFFMISLLISFTTMIRMCDEQRTIIGTYKALGYKNSEISRKYFIYGALASIIGGIIGAMVGSYLLPYIIGNAYYAGSIFENNILIRLYPFRTLIAILIGLLFTAFASLFTVNRTLKENASNLLRQKPPKTGNRILLERVDFIWKRFSFLQKITLRNIFRYKKRMVMTIIGIMGCNALLILGFGIRGSIKDIKDIQFNQIMKYNTAVIYDRDIDEDSFNEYKNMMKSKNIDYGEFYQENFTTDYKDIAQDISLIVAKDEETLRKYFTIRDRVTKEDIALEKRGAIISEKLSKIKHLKVGDSIEVKDSEDQTYKFEVSGICEMYTGHYIFISPEYYEKVFGDSFRSNADYMDLRDKTNAEIESITALATEYKSVVSVFDVGILKNLMGRFMDSIAQVETVITVASSLLAIVVLYNLTNINIEERLREISTIKVLGFYAKETTSYIYKETWILTVVGIIVGSFMGKLLHYSVLRVVAPDRAMISPNLEIYSYFVAGVIIILISLIVMVIFHNKLKKINMVEALKGNE